MSAQSLRGLVITLIAAVCGVVAGCAGGPRVAPMPAKGVDLSGEWQLNRALSTPDRLPEPERQRAERGPPEGHDGPGGLVRSEGRGPMGQTARVEGGPAPYRLPPDRRADRVALAASAHLSIAQTSDAVRIRSDRNEEKYRPGVKSAVSFGPDIADRITGWQKGTFVISTSVKGGPSKLETYSIDASGRLVVTTELNMPEMRKLELRRVYERVAPEAKES